MAQTELSPKQRKAIQALIEHGDILNAADAADVTRNTLYSWLRQPAFSHALRDAEAAAVRQLSRQLVSLGKRATGAIADVLSDPTANASSRLRGADIVLGRLLQLRELVDLEDRVSAIEERISDGT